MNAQIVAYIRVKDKDGKEYLFSLHEKENALKGFDHLSKEETVKCQEDDFPWN